VAAAVFARVAGARAEISIRCQDGERVTAGTTVLTVRGPHRRLLTAERVALNLLQHLSGVATQTSRWVEAIAGTGCAVRDTRKTTPGLHLLEKRAVRLGGGVNHRRGLGDGILIKDNHVAAAGSIGAALTAVRLGAPGQPCEVEVDDLDQLDEALEYGAKMVLLDNFTLEQCVEAVGRRDRAGGRTLLEASGGLTLEVAGAYAATGVDYVAVGELTHSAPVLDLGLDTIPTPGVSVVAQVTAAPAGRS
jgi:nicotinate-nucleotide pyrophosphorylase (carboxylating)